MSATADTRLPAEASLATEAETVALPPRTRGDFLRDVIALTKPRITLMVVITAAGGLWLAPESVSLPVMLVMLATTATVVSAANSLNCWLERDTDRLMKRTMFRPLPDGRLDPQIAFVLGIALGLFSVPTLALVVNPLTGLLGATAIISYVAVYTPMKRRAPAALLVGSIPGALPPLMCWTAATGSLDVGGLALFAVMFFWQIPHFIAIAIYRGEDYEAAGLKTLPAVRGIGPSKIQAVVYAAALVVSSLLLYVFRVAGPIYLGTAIVLGAWFTGTAIQGFWKNEPEAQAKWAKRLFIVSLVYLTVLFAVLMLDAS